jgi:hypothetical protein
MSHNRFRPLDGGYPPYHAHAHQQGPWGGRGHGPWGPSGPGRVLPLLAAALLARAALRHAPHHHEGRRGPGGRGREDWRAPRGDERGFGGPWGRGGRGHGHGRDGAPEDGRGLRAEIGGLIALLRDARRHGAPSADQVRQIRQVLADARGRIAAILAETQPPQAIV